MHIYGLVSPGGVHSSMKHLKALIKLMADNNLKDVYIHAFLDGRDTPPKSADIYLAEIEDELSKHKFSSAIKVSVDRIESVVYSEYEFGYGVSFEFQDQVIKKKVEI